jgi:hypothetical protein
MRVSPALLLWWLAVPSARAETTNVPLSVSAYSSDPAVGFADGGTGLRIEAAWITFRDVRFRPSSSCSAIPPVAVHGPVTADVVARRSTGLGEARLRLARYCAFELAFRSSRGRVTEAPSDLRGVTVVVYGRRADGLKFVVRCRLDSIPRFRAKDVGGFAITAETRLILAADIGRWLRGIDLSTADLSGDGPRQEIRIDDRTNSELLSIFRSNVEPGLALFDDVDGDGAIGDSERTRPLAAPR